MKYFAIVIGLVLIAASLFGMLFCREFTISEMVFLCGIIIVGIAYSKIHEQPNNKINTGKVNENIQSLNDILWGKDVIKLTPEQYWKMSVQDRCRDTGETWGACYCYYGGKRGYCTFERCPRRRK